MKSLILKAMIPTTGGVILFTGVVFAKHQIAGWLVPFGVGILTSYLGQSLIAYAREHPIAHNYRRIAWMGFILTTIGVVGSFFAVGFEVGPQKVWLITLICSSGLLLWCISFLLTQRQKR